MRISFTRLALGTALALGMFGTAGAQTIVLGSNDARLCFEAADIAGNTSRSGLQRCESALANDALNRRDTAATHVNYGILLFRAGRHEDAAGSYDRAIALRPDLGEAWHNRGIVWLATERFEAAEADFTRAIEEGFSEPHKAHFNRAVSYEARGMYSQAYADYQRALELRPGWHLPLRELERYEVVRGSR